MSKHTADGEYKSSCCLGEVQKMNRDGINQADVQPVGKSSYCPKHTGFCR